jgi:hypothetical protein
MSKKKDWDAIARAQYQALDPDGKAQWRDLRAIVYGE